MYQLHNLRRLGLSVRVLETGTDVGGTWYWNRYPGAPFDSESWTYGYASSEELLQEWSWKEHFSAQPDTLEYLSYVTDKFDLRKDIQFRSRVVAAAWEEDDSGWEVEIEGGERFRATFLITAVGPLSPHTLPRIEGVETFQGEACHTARWPKDGRLDRMDTRPVGCRRRQHPRARHLRRAGGRSRADRAHGGNRRGLG